MEEVLGSRGKFFFDLDIKGERAIENLRIKLTLKIIHVNVIDGRSLKAHPQLSSVIRER